MGWESFRSPVDAILYAIGERVGSIAGAVGGGIANLVRLPFAGGSGQTMDFSDFAAASGPEIPVTPRMSPEFSGQPIDAARFVEAGQAVGAGASMAMSPAFSPAYAAQLSGILQANNFPARAAMTQVGISPTVVNFDDEDAAALQFNLGSPTVGVGMGQAAAIGRV